MYAHTKLHVYAHTKLHMNYIPKPAQRKPLRNDTRQVALNEPWTAVPNRLLQDARLSRCARLLYCVMLMFAGNSGQALPSQRRLERALGRMTANGAEARPTSLRSVQRWLHELRAAGWLTWQCIRRTNLYTLTTPSVSRLRAPRTRMRRGRRRRRYQRRRGSPPSSSPGSAAGR